MSKGSGLCSWFRELTASEGIAHLRVAGTLNQMRLLSEC